MTIDELIGKSLEYKLNNFSVKKSDTTGRYYLSDAAGYIASVKKVTKTRIHWFKYILETEVNGSIPFSEITIINQ